MVRAGSSWRIAVMRPGERSDRQPGGRARLARRPRAAAASWRSTSRVLLEATLRRGSLGIVDAVRKRAFRPHDNVLVVVDQFEELFRFHRSRRSPNTRATRRSRSSSCCSKAAAQQALPDLRRADDALGFHRRLHALSGAAGGGQRGPVPGAADDARRAAPGDHRPGGGRRPARSRRGWCCGC